MSKDEDVSRTVSLTWGVAAAPQRGPKRELSHERIVEAAIRIADAEGLSAVTMQRVAQSFGFTTMALYRYVATKSELHTLMLDAAVGDEPIPVDTDDWRTGLEQLARWLLDVYRAHPWLFEIPPSAESLLLPGQVRVADAALRAMRTLPVGDEERLGLLQMLSTFVRGHAQLVRDIRHGPGVSEATRELAREVVTAARFPGLAPLIESGAFFGGDPEARPGAADADDPGSFALGLEVILGGIETVFGGRDAPPAPAPAELTPQQEYECAERELQDLVAVRKATQRRAAELAKAENRARAHRDRKRQEAKAAAKSAER